MRPKNREAHMIFTGFHCPKIRTARARNPYPATSALKLVEVGTTNKTHYSDYADAVTEETKAFLKVHTSNYRIVGFTESVGIDKLIPLGQEYDLPIIEDLGSGVLIDLSKYGRIPSAGERTWCASVEISCWEGRRQVSLSERRSISTR